MLCKDRRVGASDLRLKLQKKSATQSGKGSISGGVRDLREKLSGTMYMQAADRAPPKPKPVVEASKPARKNVIVEAPAPETKRVASLVSKKKTQQKVDVFTFSLKKSFLLCQKKREEGGGGGCMVQCISLAGH